MTARGRDVRGFFGHRIHALDEHGYDGWLLVHNRIPVDDQVDDARIGGQSIGTRLGFLPFGIAVGAAFGIATALIPQVGLRTVLTVGLLLTAAGALLFTRITPDGSYLMRVLPAKVLIALRSGLCLPRPGTTRSTMSPPKTTLPSSES